METQSFEYVVYISTTPEKVWEAIVEPRLTLQYWQHANVSDWKPGSKWEHRRDDLRGALDLVGKVLECAKPNRLVLSWAFPADTAPDEERSRVSFDIEPFKGQTRVSLLHDRLTAGSDMFEGITEGWPMVFSSMKTFLETGKPMPKLW